MTARRRSPFARGATAALALALAGALSAPARAQLAPPPGHYDAELCVATGDAAPDCGTVDATLRRQGRAHRLSVRVADIEYRIVLHSSQLDLVLMHGTTQIDGFRANYEWSGRTLEFRDPDKPVHYRVRLGGAT